MNHLHEVGLPVLWPRGRWNPCTDIQIEGMWWLYSESKRCHNFQCYSFWVAIGLPTFDTYYRYISVKDEYTIKMPKSYISSCKHIHMSNKLSYSAVAILEIKQVLKCTEKCYDKNHIFTTQRRSLKLSFRFSYSETPLRHHLQNRQFFLMANGKS